MDSALLYNPIATPITVAVCACLAIAGITWQRRATLASMLTRARQRLFTRSGLFWTVNLVFMAVSVIHAGAFFGIAGKGMAQLLGFAVSFFLDLVTIILMQAMLESRYRGEQGRARQFLFFITVCCGTSTFANLAISLNDFDAKIMLPHAPLWVQVAAPYVLASFPLFVIMMSIAAEMIVNLRPMEDLDEEEYEGDEIKRINILRIRNDYLEKQVLEEQRALAIRALMKANKQAHRPSISLPSLPFTGPQKGDIDAMISSATEQLKVDYSQEIAALKQQLNEVLNRHEDEINSVFKRPLNLDDWRFKEDYNVDGTGAIKGDAYPDADPYASPVITATKPAPKAERNTDALPIKIEIKTYENIAKTWHDQGLKTVSLDQIMEDAGLSRQKVASAKHKFSRVGRNDNLYRVASVLAWLQKEL